MYMHRKGKLPSRYKIIRNAKVTIPELLVGATVLQKYQYLTQTDRKMCCVNGCIQ